MSLRTSVEHCFSFFQPDRNLVFNSTLIALKKILAAPEGSVYAAALSCGRAMNAGDAEECLCLI